MGSGPFQKQKTPPHRAIHHMHNRNFIRRKHLHPSQPCHTQPAFPKPNQRIPKNQPSAHFTNSSQTVKYQAVSPETAEYCSGPKATQRTRRQFSNRGSIGVKPMGAGSQCVRIELVAKPGLYRRRVGRGQGDDVGHVAVDARGPIRLHAGGTQV